jgi:hypothetical protein
MGADFWFEEPDFRFQISDGEGEGGGGATLHMREKTVEACRRPVQRSSRVECARQISSRGTEGMFGNCLQISDFRFGTGNRQISSPRADFRFQISDEQI